MFACIENTRNIYLYEHSWYQKVSYELHIKLCKQYAARTVRTAHPKIWSFSSVLNSEMKFFLGIFPRKFVIIQYFPNQQIRLQKKPWLRRHFPENEFIIRITLNLIVNIASDYEFPSNNGYKATDSVKIF